MNKELKYQDAYMDALYDHLTAGDDKEYMSKEEFHREYYEWGLIVAVYNMGFLAGG